MNPIRCELTNARVIGMTSAGQKIRLGGFSGLRYLGRSPTGLYHFVTHTDRGPNADEVVTEHGHERPFGLPDFQPRMVFLDADVRLKKLFVRLEVPLTHKDGRAITGLPPGVGAEIAVDFKGNRLGFDDHGLDLEGVALAPDGTFWLSDEYGPSLVRFSADGVLLDKLSPGRGLPDLFRRRRPNRGFEGLAYWGGKLYAALESPLDNPPSQSFENSRNSRITRIVEVDAARQIPTAQFAYVLDEPDEGRISDICMENADTMLVIEKGDGWKRLYRISLYGATNLQRISSAVTLESLQPEELAGVGVIPVRKTLQLHLDALGLTDEKYEGVDRVDDKFIALITDNDFGLAGGLDRTTARAEMKDETSALYFVPLLK